MTPQEAWERIVRDGDGDVVTEDSPLDYSDEIQTSKAVVVDGERWAVVLRRVP